MINGIYSSISTGIGTWFTSLCCHLYRGFKAESFKLYKIFELRFELHILKPVTEESLSESRFCLALFCIYWLLVVWTTDIIFQQIFWQWFYDYEIVGRIVGRRERK